MTTAAGTMRGQRVKTTSVTSQHHSVCCGFIKGVVVLSGISSRVYLSTCSRPDQTHRSLSWTQYVNTLPGRLLNVPFLVFCIGSAFSIKYHSSYETESAHYWLSYVWPMIKHICTKMCFIEKTSDYTENFKQLSLYISECHLEASHECFRYDTYLGFLWFVLKHNLRDVYTFG